MNSERLAGVSTHRARLRLEASIEMHGGAQQSQRLGSLIEVSSTGNLTLRCLCAASQQRRDGQAGGQLQRLPPRRRLACRAGHGG